MDEIKSIRENRTKLEAIKWVVEDDDTLPFWIADMDLKSPKFIQDSFEKRAAANYYGYTKVNQAVFSGISTWYKIRNQVQIETDQIILANGLKSSYAIALERFMKPNDAAVLMTPLYPPLTKIIQDLGHTVYQSQLKCETNRYEIDFENLEKQLKTHPEISTMVICNPHNPVGRAWTKEELFNLAKLGQKYNLLIIVDEIHADLTFEQQNFHTFIEVARLANFTNYLVLGSPAKTFNIAGLKASYVISDNQELLKQLQEKLAVLGSDQLSLFAITAIEAIYLDPVRASSWVDQLLQVLKENYQLVVDKLSNQPRFELTKSDATYLAWIKINDLNCADSSEAKEILKNKFKIDLNDGRAYAGDGNSYVRFNFACPKEMLAQGLDRLIQAADSMEL